MKSRLIEKIRGWRKRKEQRHISDFLTPNEMRFALLGWEGARTGAAYMNQESGGSLEVAQTGYTYIFKMANILRLEDMQKEEDRIREGLAAGVLILDARVSLVDVKPHLKVIERGKGNGDKEGAESKSYLQR